MKRFLTLTVLGLLAAAATHAQNALPSATAQSVNVIMPDGSMLAIAELPNAPWWKDPRVLPYDRYVFDPGHNAYRVYDSATWKDYEGKWGGIGSGGNRRPGSDAPQPLKTGIVTPDKP